MSWRALRGGGGTGCPLRCGRESWQGAGARPWEMSCRGEGPEMGSEGKGDTLEPAEVAGQQLRGGSAVHPNGAVLEGPEAVSCDGAERT